MPTNATNQIDELKLKWTECLFVRLLSKYIFDLLLNGINVVARIIWCIKSGCTFCGLSLIIFDGRISSIHFYVRQILFPFAFDQKVDPNLVHSSIKPYIWLTSLVYLSLYSLEVGFALHELTSQSPNLKGIHVRIFVQSYFSASGLNNDNTQIWQRRSMLRSSVKRKKRFYF